MVTLARLIDSVDADLFGELREWMSELEEGGEGADQPDWAPWKELQKELDAVLRKSGTLRGMEGDGFGLHFLQVLTVQNALALRARQLGDQQELREQAERLLAWSAWVRRADPTLIDLLMACFLWRVASDRMWDDWVRCEDPEARLAEIEVLMGSLAFRADEWRAVECRELEWYRGYGGFRTMLKDWGNSPMGAIFLREPFTGLTGEDLMSLPLNRGKEWELVVKGRREMIAFHGSERPLNEAPALPKPATGSSLDDYRSMPNGLCHLFEEQMEPGMTIVGYGLPMATEALLKTAIAWLRAEAAGATEFEVARDPVTGEALKIDRKARVLRATGNDLEYSEAPWEGDGFGFRMVGDDLLLRIPPWPDR